MSVERGTDTWQPLPKIYYGFALHPFSPTTYAPQIASSQHARHTSTSSSADVHSQADPFMVDLEVGDEVYAFEKYVPRTGGDRNVWFRGYVVSTSRTPYPTSRIESTTASFSSTTGQAGSTGAGKAPEPSVFLGIFPASFVHVREELDDAEGRLGATWQEFEENRRLDEGRFGSGAGKGKARMEALPEDEEEDEEDNLTSNGSVVPRTYKQPTASTTSNSQTSSTRHQALSSFAREKLPPPIPSLKAGDETLAGSREPLVDEIACALREWYLRLFTYLLQRDYNLFKLVQNHISALHLARRQLIDQSLGSEELAEVRKDCVARLVKGNVEQGLDVLVRHPTWGGLVTVLEGDDEIASVDVKSFISGIRMYTMQVAAAYIGSASPPLSGRSALPPLSTVHAASIQKPRSYHRPTGSQSTLSLNRLVAPKKLSLAAGAGSESEPSGSEFHHLFLEVRAFVANPCMAGETAELYFSLYSMTTHQFITEEYLVVMDHHGTPAFDPLKKVRTLFKDLGAQELGGIALVCRIVRVGDLKMSTVGSSIATPPPSVRSSIVGGDSLNGGSPRQSNGFQPAPGAPKAGLTAPYRRPFGCAVVDVSRYMKPSSSSSTKSVSMQIHVPVDEAGFASLHEDIINGRTEFYTRSPRADTIAVDVKSFFGRPQAIAKDHPSLMEGCPLTEPLGFPDVVFPGQVRNDLYIKLWTGDFTSTTAGKGRKGAFGVGAQATSGVLQVTVEVRRQQGVVGVDKAISRGARELPVSEFTSLVFTKTTTPTFGELIKISNLEPEVMKDCHLFITYRQRSVVKDKSTPTDASGLERPFAFSYLPLHPTETGVFLPDGNHDLIVYRADKLHTLSPSQYYAMPSVLPQDTTIDDLHLAPDLARVATPLRDSLSIRSFLCSTIFTQSEVLVRLLSWEKNGLSQDQNELAVVLKNFAFVSEVEICKVLKDVFDALFGILNANSTDSPNVVIEALVFDSLVTVLGIVQDRRFTNFKPVLDVYIDQHFAFASVWRQLIRSMSRLLADKTSQQLRSAIKVWHYVFRFISRSRELQKQKDSSLGGTSERLTEHLESAFKTGLDLLLRDFIDLMRMTQPSSIIGTQTIALQHFSDILPDLARTFDAAELSEIIISFSDAAPQGNGKAVVWKLLLHLQTARSVVFDDASARASLVPSLVRWIKPFLGRRPTDVTSSSNGEGGEDAAHITWVESVRLAVTVLAVILDRLSEFLVLAAKQSRTATLQEKENIDLIFSCLPKLLESYHELRSRPTLEAIDRHQASSSVIHPVPVVFPSTSPSPLISPPPGVSNKSNASVAALNNTLGEVAAVILVLLVVQPTDGIKAFLDEQLEVEGKDNLNRTLLSLFEVSSSILRFEAFPRHWLNISLLAHTAILKCLKLLTGTMVALNVPISPSADTFNVPLWNACFQAQFLLLSSDQVIIESFSPQKRRAVWRLAGDIRGDGADTLRTMWQTLGEPKSDGGVLPAYGCYQTKFLGFVQDVLTLCLSHHDHLRTTAVEILCTMILSVWESKGNFDEVKSEIIDKLDVIFMQGGEGDDLTRVYFVTSLRGMFDEPSVDPLLREAVHDFLDSIDGFLDLLLNLRDLPEGEQYQDDKTVCTLRLLNFIRRIGGRDAMYIQYVHQLVDAHVRGGDYAEAGLTLKMHAALYDWKSTETVESFAYGDLVLPRQSSFARKEALLLQTLDYLGRGKAFELAIDTCQELEYQHANVTFDYLRLAELLSHHSRLSESIVLEQRPTPHYFLVSYFGPFPSAVRNRQFIYRGADWEKYGGFTDRLQSRHPSARLLKSIVVPDAVRDGQDLVCQVVAVVPEPDRSKSVLRPEVPKEIRAFYETNNIKHFSYSRTFSRTGSTGSEVDPADTFVERTYYTTEESLPALIRRSEVVAERSVEISGLENAVHDIQTKTTELDAMESKYITLLDSDEEADTGPLSMALNGAVDAPHNGGVPAYRKAFFSPEYLEKNPLDAEIIEELRITIDLHVLAIHRCLGIHGALCPESMMPFHVTILQFFFKNFADEIERLHLTAPEVARHEPAPVGRASESVQSSRTNSVGQSNGHMSSSDSRLQRNPSVSTSIAGTRNSISSNTYSASLVSSFQGPTSTTTNRDRLGSHDARSISQFSAYSVNPPAPTTMLNGGGPKVHSASLVDLSRLEPANGRPLYTPVSRRISSDTLRTSSVGGGSDSRSRNKSESRLSRLGSVLRKKSLA